MAEPSSPNPSRPIDVALFLRAPGPGRHSLERMVASLVKHSPPSVRLEVQRCPAATASPMSILRNLLWARRRGADVNLVLGNDQYLVLALPGKRTVLTILDLTHRNELDSLKRRLYEWLWFDLPLRRATRIVALSERTKADALALERCEAEKIEVIPIAIPEGLEPAYHRPPESEPRVLHIGSMENKNLERHVRVAKEAGVTLVLVGALSPQQLDLVAAIGGTVDYRGEVSDSELASVYHSVDALLFASLSEGFGMPIIEAQAVGVPVVTSNLEPMIDVSGEAACLVDPVDQSSILAGLQRVLSDQSYRAELVRRGLENARRFDPARIALQYARVFQKVARS